VEIGQIEQKLSSLVADLKQEVNLEQEKMSQYLNNCSSYNGKVTVLTVCF